MTLKTWLRTALAMPVLMAAPAFADSSVSADIVHKITRQLQSHASAAIAVSQACQRGDRRACRMADEQSENLRQQSNRLSHFVQASPREVSVRLNGRRSGISPLRER